MEPKFDGVFYEPPALDYPLGARLWENYKNLPWTAVESHNKIDELRQAENRMFPKLKRLLVVGVRKTHKYVENHKVSDYLVPFTSSGCTAMCLYCYLVCNYNKCAYLRVFVNREEMMSKLLKTDRASERPLTFEIGSNSDLVLENTVTGNLPSVIERFAAEGRGSLTFPTKFDMVAPLLELDHRGKTIFRMSVNPPELIRRVELGTSPLEARVRAVNDMCASGYPVGILLAPVILVPGWEEHYGALIDYLAGHLSEKVKGTAFFEIIFMTYSFVQNAINAEAFPNAIALHDKTLMTGRGRGKYCYRDELRTHGEAFLRRKLSEQLGNMPILYVV